MGTTKALDFFIDKDEIFEKEDYGRPISETLSIILRRNVTKNDYANIAIKSNVSFSTIRDVVYRSNSLTKSNANAICLLIHAAFENSIAHKLRSEGDIMFLNQLLKI